MARDHRSALRAIAAVGVVAAMALGTALAASPATPSTRAPAAPARSEFKKKPKDRTTDVHVLAFNDFHGNLQAGAGLNIYGQFAGGAAWLAAAIADKQRTYGHNELTVHAGDNIGASPLVDGLFFGEPSTIVANLMHVDFASVGNHEFDKGSRELLRIQHGGCRQDVGCSAAPYALADGGTTNRYPGADFQYLSANVTVDATGRTLFPAFGIKRFKGDSGKKFDVGVIGEVLKDTPTIVTPTGVAGLTFGDEADAANRVVKKLRRRGVRTSILVVHQGGFQSGTASLNGCAGSLAGSDILKIVERLDPSIKVIVSGHTHAEYNCVVRTTDGTRRLVTSASSFGRVLSDITLTIDDKTGELLAASALNSIVRNSSNPRNSSADVPLLDLPSDPRVAAVVAQYVAASAPLANRVIGSIQGDLTRADVNGTGETTMGDVIADAQLAATSPSGLGGAVVAFQNPGGVRGDLFVDQISGGEGRGQVTYGEAFTVQPFGNSLVTKTMTGAQIRALLEQQFPGCGGQTTKRVLQVSVGFTYMQNPSAADCASHVGAIAVNGTAVDPTAAYRVTMNNFLATGGDGFTVFNQGTDALGGAQDIDALVDYFQAAPGGVAVPPVNRITLGT
jgi:5'-nucleotidase